MEYRNAEEMRKNPLLDPVTDNPRTQENYGKCPCCHYDVGHGQEGCCWEGSDLLPKKKES